MRKSCMKLCMRDDPKRRIGVGEKTFTLSKERARMNAFVFAELLFTEVIRLIVMILRTKIEECE